MSRIFDALRRSEQERVVKTSAAPLPDDDRRLQDVLGSLEKQPFRDNAPVEGPPAAEETQPWDLERVGICHVRPQEPVVAHSLNHVGAEKFRVLCHRLRQFRQQRTFRSVLVTSAIPKDGKTVVALNMAITFACSSPRVLLVDTDLRRSGLREVLGLPSMPGLADVLEGRAELAGVLRKIEPFGLYCLLAGTSAASPVELLQHPRMSEVMAQVAGAFDWVVLDSPPLNPFADARCIAPLVDGVVMVVRAGWTPREGLQQGLAALEGANVAGVVLNGSSDRPDDHYYYYYYSSSETKATKTADAPSIPAGEAVSVHAAGNQDGIEA